MKTKKFPIICLLFAGILTLTSCNTKKSAVNKLESLVVEVEEEGKSYTLDDWKMVIYRYTKIEEKLNKHEYSAEEHKEIGKLKGRLLGSATKDVLINCYEKVDGIRNQIDGSKEGFIKGLLTP